MAFASELCLPQFETSILTALSTKNRWSMVLSLLFATVMRTFLVIISYGCKVPAGIFVPSMAIGASFGRMVGILVQALHESFPHAKFFAACEPDVPCITPGTYAFLGAAAALSGIMHITVSVVVIMFELTGALTYILPTMVSSKRFSILKSRRANGLTIDCRWSHKSGKRALWKGRHSRPNDLVQRLSIPGQQRRAHVRGACLVSYDKRSHLIALLWSESSSSGKDHVSEQVPGISHRRRPRNKGVDWLYWAYRITICNRSSQKGGFHLTRGEMLLHATRFDCIADPVNGSATGNIRRHRIRRRPAERRLQPIHRPNPTGSPSALTARDRNGALQEDGPSSDTGRVQRPPCRSGDRQRLPQIPIQSRGSRNDKRRLDA